MNLALSKRGDYVVRAVLVLARAYRSGERTKLRQISAETGVPRTYASQILGDLLHAGLAVSSSGLHGGYRLARNPSEVSLLEVVEAGEGPLANGCCPQAEGPSGAVACPLHEAWSRASETFRSELATTSLADLLARDEAIEAGAGADPAAVLRVATPTVAVADDVQVELAAPVVAARLQAGGSWLTSHARAASAEGEAARLRVGPGGPTWLGKTVAVRLGPAEDVDGTLVMPLAWEATGPSALFPRLEGELRVEPVDPDRSQLSLTGRYRPPLGRAGLVLDEVLLVHVARATVRSFLRRVSWALDETARRRPASQAAELGPSPAASLAPAPDPGAPRAGVQRGAGAERSSAAGADA